MNSLSEEYFQINNDRVNNLVKALENECEAFRISNDPSMPWESLFFECLSSNIAEAPAEFQNFNQEKIQPLLSDLPWTIEITADNLQEIFNFNQRSTIMQYIIRHLFGYFCIEVCFKDFVILKKITIEYLTLVPFIVIKAEDDLPHILLLIVSGSENRNNNDAVLKHFERINRNSERYLTGEIGLRDPVGHIIESAGDCYLPKNKLSNDSLNSMNQFKEGGKDKISEIYALFDFNNEDKIEMALKYINVPHLFKRIYKNKKIWNSVELIHLKLKLASKHRYELIVNKPNLLVNAETLYTEGESRNLSRSEYQFIFGIDLKKVENMNKVGFNGKNIKDPWHQALFYTHYFLRNREWTRMSAMFTQFLQFYPGFKSKDIDKPKASIDFLLSEYEEYIPNDDLFALLCLISFTPQTSLKKGTCTNYRKIIDSLINNFNNNLSDWKSNKNYPLVIEGLSTVFLSFRLSARIKFYHLLNDIEDSDILCKFLNDISELLVSNNMPYLLKPKKEGEILFGLSQRINDLAEKKKIINKFICCASKFRDIISVINYNSGLIDHQKVAGVILRILSKKEYKIKVLPYIMIELNKLNDNIKAFLNPNVLSKFLERSILKPALMVELNFDYYTIIISEFQRAQEFINFNPRPIIMTFILKLGFTHSKTLVLLDNKNIDYYFESWFKIISTLDLKTIRIFDSEIFSWPENCQYSFANFALENLFKDSNGQKIIELIDEINKCKSKVIVNIYKSLLKKNIQEDSKFQKSAKKYLKIKRPENSVWVEMFKFIAGDIDQSPVALRNSIIINPQDGVLLKYLLKSRKDSNAVFLKPLFDFVNEFLKSIQEKTTFVQDLIYINDHSEVHRRIFYKYIESVISYSTEFEFKAICNALVKSLETLTAVKAKLEDLNKFFSCFCSIEMNFESEKKIFESFKSQFTALPVMSLVLPNELLTIENTIQIIKLGLSSHIFSVEMNKSKGNTKAESLLMITEAYTKYKNLIQDLDNMNINSIRTNIASLKTEDISNEVTIIHEIIERKSRIEKVLDYLFLEKAAVGIFRNVLLSQDYFKFNEYEALKSCEKFLSLYTDCSINDYTLNFEAASIILSKISKDSYASLLELYQEFNNSKELICFTQILGQDEVDVLSDGLDAKNVSTKLTASILLNFKILWSFFTKLMSLQDSVPEFLSMIVSLSSSSKYPDLILKLRGCNMCLKELHRLNFEVNNQEQAKIERIKHIYKESTFRVSESLDFTFNVGSKADGAEINYKLSDISELKERALLSKNMINFALEDKDNSENDMKIFETFIEFADMISRYFNSIKELNKSLFKEKIKFNFTYTCSNGQFSEASNDEKKYLRLIDNWKKTLSESSRKFYWLNFLYGKRLLGISSIFLKSNKNDQSNHRPLFDFMGKHFKNKFKKIPDPSDDMITHLKHINETIEKFDNKLKEYKFTNLTHQNIIKQDPRQIILCETDSFFKGILSIYYNTYRPLPTIDKIYFCSFSTNWGDLKFFLNRCFINKVSLYTLVNPEELSLENQIKIKAKLMKFFNTSTTNFFIAIVTNNSISNLVNFIKYQQEITVINVLNYQLLDSSVMAEILRDFAKDIAVYSSTSVGLGKTEMIKQRIKELHIDHVEINISGSIGPKALGKILHRYQRDKPAAFHIQINYVEDYNLIHQLMFSLTIFKQYYTSKILFSLPEKSYIFIEIANTCNNILHKNLPFLQSLPQNHIPAFSLSNLILTDKVQYVSRYLSYFSSKRIDKEDLCLKNREPLLSHQEIENVISQYFHCPMPSYHQLTTFLNILATIFQNFEKSNYSAQIIANQLQEYGENGTSIYGTLRSTIISSIIKTSEEFTSQCVSQVKTNQNSNMNAIEDKKKLIAPPELKHVIKWENSNHFTIVFLEDGASLCIYRYQQQVPYDIKSFLSLQRQQIVSFRNRAGNQSANIHSGIDDYQLLNCKELLEKLIDVYFKQCFKDELKSLNVEEKKYITDEALKSKKIIKLMSSGYILTPDNFLKMNLIYLRCISGIPLFIMGETGCGKTSLIRFFVNEILRESLEIISIHSGTTSEYIYEKIEKLNALAKQSPNTRFWAFFDEFNTSDCIGMICDIICDRKINELTLLGNLILVGACNPYRVKPAKMNHDENIGIKKASATHSNNLNLVHIVKPLPDKAIEFVWDFGALNPIEMKAYIKRMLENHNFSNENIFTEILCTAHEYFQKLEDNSSVSLRDINRFTRLYSWFKTSLAQREKYPPAHMNKKFTDLNLFICKTKIDNDLKAGLLAVFHCYLLRISSQDLRNDFLSMVIISLKQFQKNITLEILKSLIKDEQLDFLSRMIIPKETALNFALTENIFALFPCIFNKIPILICGKPGCSKSLALQIITSSLRGDKSADNYLKTLPELQTVCFQGSDSCTSEGILEVFEKAKKFNKYRHILPIVIFDEIGLAEISKHNPLKVLHSLLEAENCDVAFIGISNWRLDSSKMNRTLYLARPDPSQDDLIDTAVAIYKSTNSDMQDESVKMIICAARAYHNLKQQLSSTGFPDFYGLRDFYHMIKHSSKLISAANSHLEMIQGVCKAIDKNFGGIQIPNRQNTKKFKGNSLMLELFLQQFPIIEEVIPATPVMDLVIENLSDSNSRYLMIICQRDITSYLIEILKKRSSKKINDWRLITGSTFELDLAKDDLNFRILSDIILFMEQGIPIILQDMDSVYSSLYDLFNQNFVRSTQTTKKYCRIALGAQFNPRCFVHEDFKVLVFMDNSEESVRKADAPFLNRFEKHHISLSDLITPLQQKVYSTVKSWIDSISSQKNSLSILSIFPCFSVESINILICFNEKITDEKECFNTVKKFFIKTSSLDLKLLYLFQSKKYQQDDLINYWNLMHKLTFPQYIEKKLADGEKLQKLITITYDTASIDGFFKKQFGDRIELQKCSGFKKEQELHTNFLAFLKSFNQILYVLELEFSKESQHLNFIIQVLNKFEKERIKYKKKVMIVIRMSRNDENRKPLCIYNGWKFRMFESLHENDAIFVNSLDDLSSTRILNDEKLIRFEEIAPEIVQIAIGSFSYRQAINKNEDIIKYKNFISKEISESKNILEILKDILNTELMKATINSEQMWFKSFFTEGLVLTNATSVRDAFYFNMKYKYLAELTKILVAIERESGLNSLLKLNLHPNLQYIWNTYLNKINTKMLKVQLQTESNSMTTVKKLSLPLVEKELKILKDLYKVFQRTLISEPEFSRLSLFKTNHKKSSYFKNSIEMLYETQSLQNLLIEDFIILALTEEVPDFKLLPFIKAFIDFLIDSDSLEIKLIKYFDFENKIITLYKIFETYQKYTQLELKWVHLAIYNNNDRSNSIQAVAFEILNKMINEVLPSNTILSRCQGIKNYLEQIEDFSESVKELGEIVCPRALNFDNINMAVNLCRVNLPVELLISWAKLYREKKSSKLPELLIKTFIPKLRDLLKNNSNDSDKGNLNSLIAYIYSEYIKTTGQCPESLISDIDRSDLWEYSRELIETIIEKNEIIELVMRRENESTQLNNEYLCRGNKQLNSLISAINSTEIHSKFCVLLSDRLYSNLKPLAKSISFEKILALSKFYDSALKKSSIKLLKIISAARLRLFLELFAELLILGPGSFDEMSSEFVNNFPKLCFSDCLTYELFVVRTMKATGNYNFSELLTILRDNNCSWSYILISLKSNEGDLSIIPYINISNSDYKAICAHLRNISRDMDSMDSLLKSQSSINFRLMFGLAAINEIYLKYKDQYFNSQPYMQWVESKKKLITDKQGEDLFNFIESVVHNFPKDSKLFLTPQVSFNELIETQSILLIIIVAVAYSIEINPVSVFLPSSKYFKAINSSFCIGAEPGRMLDYLLSLSRNFDRLKSNTWRAPYSIGSSYVCSDTCDYLYIVNACGGPMQKFNCPFCNNLIGGQNHIPVARPGHRNLNDQDALNFLQKKVADYCLNELKGFKMLDNSLPLTEVRNLKHSYSFNLLNLIPSSILYYSHIKKIVSPKILQEIFSKNDSELSIYLKKSISQNISEIYSNISSSEPFVWLLSSISLLPKLIEKYKNRPLDMKTRDNFESDFEELLLSESITERINSYKKNIAGLTKSDEIVEYLEGIKEPSNQYPYWQLFRIVQNPSLESLMQSFNNSSRKNELILLNKFLVNQELAQKLKIFWPIIEFSKKMVIKFSFSISRHDAQNIAMRDIVKNDIVIGELFSRFLDAWTHVDNELHFGCRRIKKPEFTLESPICNFLVENSLNSQGIALRSAITTLAEIQNDFLTQIRKDIEKKPCCYIPLDSLKESDILSFNFDLEELMNNHYLNSPFYLLGKDIIYDFDKIQKIISKSISKAKLIDLEDFHQIQYQNELLNIMGKYSGILNEVMQNIQQEPLSEAKLKEIENAIKGRKAAREAAMFSEVNTWLEKVLYSSRHINKAETKIGEITLFGFTNARALDSVRFLYDIKLKNIISLYEFIELKSYPDIVKRIESDYKVEIVDKDEVKKLINKLINKLKQQNAEINLLDINNALKRFIMRILTAYIEPRHRLKDYLINESLWPVEKNTWIESTIEEFPEDFNLSQSVSLQNILEEMEIQKSHER